METVADVITCTLLTLMAGGIVYVMFWQPKDRQK